MKMKTTSAQGRVFVDILDLIGWLNERAVEQPEHAPTLRGLALTLDDYHDELLNPEKTKVESAVLELKEWIRPETIPLRPPDFTPQEYKDL